MEKPASGRAVTQVAAGGQHALEAMREGQHGVVRVEREDRHRHVRAPVRLHGLRQWAGGVRLRPDL